MDHQAIVLAVRADRRRSASIDSPPPRPRRYRRLSEFWALGLLALAAAMFLSGCAGGGPAAGQPGAEAGGQEVEPAIAAPPGTTPVRLDFLYAFENERDAPYYPIEGIAGVAYGADGTLIFCDEKGGRVHGLAPGTGNWYAFDSSPSRSFRPIDVRVDGFSVLVLDLADRLLLRYDMAGVLQDRLLNFRQLDPLVQRLPTAFDVDVDGRVVVTDAQAQQVLLLDPFLSLSQTLGEPGSHREQFDEPSGVVFLPDGGFAVADRGNRRLQLYNRLGYYETMVGGEFDLDNRLITPQGLDRDEHGNLFVADGAAGQVHVYGRGPRWLFSLSSEMGLLAAPEAPVDVATGPDQLLAVADRGREAVLVYRIVYD
jgi:hypothetical protein